MNQPFELKGFTFESTKDGSPTLRLDSSGESMHHFDGAASETWYIYGIILQAGLRSAKVNNLRQVRVASIGLGLGYIEQAWALIKCAEQVHLENLTFTIDSFEKNKQLKKNFLDWIKLENQANLSEVYNLVLAKLKEASQISLEISAFLKNELQLQNLRVHENIFDYCEHKKWDIICFDAFSKKTNEDIWSNDYLEKFIQNYSAENCIFSTYASTSALKKILIKNNFHLIQRLGFSGKRESTLALRGTFKDDFATFQTFLHTQ